MSKLVSFAVLLAFIAIIGALFYKVMFGFLVPVFLAAVLVVVFRPLHRYITKKVRNREHLAAAITTTIILCVVLLPAGFIITTAAVQGAGLFRKLDPNSISAGLAKIQKTKAFRNFLEMQYQDEIWPIINDENELQKEIAKEQPFSFLKGPDARISSYLRRLSRDFIALREAVKDKQPAQFEVRYEAMFDACVESLGKIRDPLMLTPANGETRKPNLAPSTVLPEPVLEDDARVPEGRDDVALNDSNAMKNSVTEPTNRLNKAEVQEENEPIDIIEIQSRAAEFRNRWEALKTEIMGGEIKAFLKETANPDQKRKIELSNTVYDFIKPRLFSLTSSTGGFLARLLIGCGILSVSLFFFLYDGPAMIRSIMQLSPLDDRYEQELLMEFDRTSRAVVLAMIFSAIVQGLLAGVGYWAVGMPSLTFLVLLTMMCALVPFVGPALVWVPVCFYLVIYHEDNPFLAIGLALWGTFVVGTADNFVKMFVLHGQRQLHPLLALLSVLGGVQSLGPIGILVGPMAVTMLQTLLGILQHELSNLDAIDKRVRPRKRKKRDSGNAVSTERATEVRGEGHGDFTKKSTTSDKSDHPPTKPQDGHGAIAPQTSAKPT